MGKAGLYIVLLITHAGSLFLDNIGDKEICVGQRAEMTRELLMVFQLNETTARETMNNGCPCSLNAEDKGTESSMLESVGLRNKGLKGWTGAG
jgi:hypothetical protein